MVETYDTKLLKKEMVANNTMAFTFQKPDGFEYKAGQYGDIIILDPPETDEGGNMRGFSFVSEPHDEHLVMTTRLRNTAFKRVLRNLPDSTPVQLKAPFGNFALHKTESTPAVFISGGIGVTPVKGIISEATRKKYPHDITLLYSNRTPEDTAFLDDFKEDADKNEHFTFVPVMTKSTPDEWDGEHGYIDDAMLKRYVKDVSKPIYYLSGPPEMVQAMVEMLIKAGANEDNIRTEEFSGY